MIVRFLSRDLFTVTILRFPVKLSALVFLSLQHVSTMFCLTAHLLGTLRQYGHYGMSFGVCIDRAALY